MASYCLGVRSLLRQPLTSRIIHETLRTQRTYIAPSSKSKHAFQLPQSQLRISLWKTPLTQSHPCFRVSQLPNSPSSSPLPNLRRWLSTSRPSFRHHVPPSYQQSPLILGFLDKIPQNVIFVGIIVLNSIVFVMWYLAGQKYQQQRDPGAILWMRQNFTSSWENLASGRIWTPLTSCFSHQSLSHILMNGFTFFFMAKPVLSLLGSRQFLFLYIGGGLVSSYSSIAYARWAGKRDYSSLGASGATFSIITLLACVAPKMQFYIYGIIPFPAWLAVTGLFSWDMYATLSDRSGTTDTVGHVGGVLAGLLYFAVRWFRIF